MDSEQTTVQTPSTSTPDAPSLPGLPAPAGRAGLLRRLVKRIVYSQLMLREAVFIVLGRSRPFVKFNVETEPPSVYLNFRIRPDRIDALRDFLALPDQLSLCPIRCLEGEQPFHVLALNVYRVSGLANGMRAEWSVYVRDETGAPRYLVVEARADAFSMDPVNVFTRAGSVEHALDDGQLRSRVVLDAAHVFESELQLPPIAERKEVRAAGEWVEANDFIFWRNGVCDRTFYDGALAVAPLWLLPADGRSLRDGTAFSEFIDPEPVHVVALSRRVQFAMSPWWNV